MFKTYHQFLKRSLHAHPHDIVRPYHKIVDLGFKLVSLAFAIMGVLYLVATPACYLATMSDKESVACTFIMSDNYEQTESTTPQPVSYFVMYWLTGFGYMIISIFGSQVLILRHINETLPDHIYLRCFATIDEKKKRLPIKD